MKWHPCSYSTHLYIFQLSSCHVFSCFHFQQTKASYRFFPNKDDEYYISSLFHFYTYLTLTHILPLKIPCLHIWLSPQIPQTCPSIPTQFLASQPHALTHTHTHTHPSLFFIFNPVSQTLLTDDADPHAALTPSARMREREREAGKTGTSCGKKRRRRENKVPDNNQRWKSLKCTTEWLSALLKYFVR